MPPARPLTPEEVPDVVADGVLWDQHFIGDRGLRVRRVCPVCSEVFDSLVSDMRSTIKRGRRLSPYCWDCAHSEGEHQRGWRRPKVKGGTTNKDGYKVEYLPEHPNAQKTGYILVHRRVMADHIGRPLRSNETVHHINGVRDDNRIENLELRNGQHGPGVRVVCGDCGSENILHAELAV